MQITSTDVVAGSVAITGTSLANLALFSDPMYLWLSIFSGVVGFVSALNDLDELEKLKLNFHTFFSAFKGAFIGFFSAPAMFTFLAVFGAQLFSKFGLDVVNNETLITVFYWSVSLIFPRVIVLGMLNFNGYIEVIRAFIFGRK